MKLFRRSATGYAGAGSFWSDDPAQAEKYGRGKQVTCELSGPVLSVDSDLQLEQELTRLGFEDAEQLVSDSEWSEPDVLSALSKQYAWLSKPIDLSVSRAREYVKLRGSKTTSKLTAGSSYYKEWLYAAERDLDVVRESDGVAELLAKHGEPAVLAAMAAIFQWKNSYQGKATAREVLDYGKTLAGYMPSAVPTLYRGLHLRPNHAIAQKQVGDVFSVSKIKAVSAWTPRKSFAQAWANHSADETLVVLKLKQPRADVRLCSVSAMAPVLRKLLSGMPDAHEDEWLLADDQLKVEVVYMRAAKSKDKSVRGSASLSGATAKSVGDNELRRVLKAESKRVCQAFLKTASPEESLSKYDLTAFAAASEDDDLQGVTAPLTQTSPSSAEHKAAFKTFKQEVLAIAAPLGWKLSHTEGRVVWITPAYASAAAVPAVLYHATRPENAESILKTGLLPGSGKGKGRNYRNRIYLTTSKSAAAGIAKNGFGISKPAVFAVDTKKAGITKLLKDPEFEDGVYVTQPIPRKAILRAHSKVATASFVKGKKVNSASALSGAHDPQFDKNFKRLGVSDADRELYVEWTYFGVIGKTDAELQPYAEMFKRLLANDKVKKDRLPAKVYRSLDLPQGTRRKLRAGETVEMKARPVSAWSSDRSETQYYGNVVLTRKPPSKALYLGPKLQAALRMEYGRGQARAYTHAHEHEVVVFDNKPMTLKPSAVVFVKAAIEQVEDGMAEITRWTDGTPSDLSTEFAPLLTQTMTTTQPVEQQTAEEQQLRAELARVLNWLKADDVEPTAAVVRRIEWLVSELEREREQTTSTRPMVEVAVGPGPGIPLMTAPGSAPTRRMTAAIAARRLNRCP